MSAETADLSPWWRVLLAFALAPAVAALAFSCASPFYEGLDSVLERIWLTFSVVAVIGGYLPTLVVGFPLYAVLRRRLRPTLLNCTLVAAGVAAFPWLMFSLLPAAQSASVDGHATVVDHHVTFLGLWEGVKLAAMTGIFGALGGLAFWFVATAGRPHLAHLDVGHG